MPVPQHRWLGRILDGLLFVSTVVAVTVGFWHAAPAWADPAILVLFFVLFATRWNISEDRPLYLKKNWLDLVLIVLLASPLLRIFSALRVMRLLPALRVGVLIRANRKRLLNLIVLSQDSFPAAMTLVFGFVFVFGASVYFLEHDVNEQFGTISDGLWWAFVTLTTVGYGDIYPMTTSGRIVAVFTMIFGIALYSLLVANLTFFVEEQGRKRALEALEKEKKMPLDDQS
ncbi:MAG: potassium channel family protein [Mariprofundaceae bacterium]|nr:potassium channel family protein [Mariprofundaceae bacterium]